MGCTVHTSIAVHATCSAASSTQCRYKKKLLKKARLTRLFSVDGLALRFPCLVSLRYGAQAVVISVDPRRVYVTSPEATARHTIKTVRLCTETGSNLAGLFWLGPTNRLVHSQFRPWEPGGSSFSLKDGVVVQNKQTNTKPACPLSNLTRFLHRYQRWPAAPSTPVDAINAACPLGLRFVAHARVPQPLHCREQLSLRVTWVLVPADWRFRDNIPVSISPRNNVRWALPFGPGL